MLFITTSTEKLIMFKLVKMHVIVTLNHYFCGNVQSMETVRNCTDFIICVFMPPLFVECGRALSVAHVRPSVRPCMRPSVRPSFRSVLCERNSSYNFLPILLKLYRCFCQGLKMCMTFGYNPQINFCHFFHSLNLVNFGLNYY